MTKLGRKFIHRLFHLQLNNKLQRTSQAQVLMGSQCSQMRTFHKTTQITLTGVHQKLYLKKVYYFVIEVYIAVYICYRRNPFTDQFADSPPLCFIKISHSKVVGLSLFSHPGSLAHSLSSFLTSLTLL